ncbi:TetR/AcrR family transcriptional regulator [Nocardioides cavernaquae]|uniref:TetR/AcrR family transcriptional regulator n=1 Tax=Nocardioides cavernaquae TaxID=2321396 RepID=A0A3A5HBF6_9ACTN|nr:TetR/AcrR family transcriptional regulator [Nocardioides cavernaquae]RJS46745.1 TetR/AcrR family transcriptional regulator [Nocardioides cavernaquae]
MTEVTRRAPLKRTPRPRDRKQQIVAAAGELFYRHGFHNVGTGQIADSVGITAGALYRHFKGKQDLLSHTLTEAFDQATRLVTQNPPRDLQDLIRRIASTAGERRYLGILWNREARFLSDDARAAMRERFFAFLDEFARQLRSTRPDLSAADADLLAWSALAVLTSPSYHGSSMDPGALVDLLEQMTLAACTTPLAHPSPTGSAPEPESPGLLPHGRREATLAAATRLFHDRGYQAVSMEDVGESVGISGAAIYKYFPRKADLLSAVIARASEPLQLGATRALARARDSREGLENLLDAYVEFALVHHDLVGILVAEVTNLPDEHRRDVRRAQHDYVAEWIRLIRETRPALDESQARFVVHAALTVINDVARTDHLRARPAVDDDLRSICRRILDVQL